MYLVVDCECTTVDGMLCPACEQETLERGIESAMLSAEDGAGED